MPLSKSLLIDSAMILTLILIGMVGYKLSPLLLPKTDVTVVPDPACDLQLGACDTLLPGGGRLKLSLAPQPIPVITPIAILIEYDGIDIEKAAVDFAGVSMNMGFNRRSLSPAGTGRFIGQATLPVCVTGKMVWQATILIESGRTRIAVPFRFEAGH